MNKDQCIDMVSSPCISASLKSKTKQAEFLFVKILADILGPPRWLNGKESVCNAGDLSSIPGLKKSPGEGNGNPLHYSCLDDFMDRGAWEPIVQGVAKSRTQLGK